MSLSDRYDMIAFDFDGTLCDSVAVKNEAFRLLYLDERGPEFADRVYAYHLDHVGVSRYLKIRHIEREMIGSVPTEQRVQEVADRFGRMVEEQVIAAPLFEGVADFLDSGVLPLAVVSATPTDELRGIVAAKVLDHAFVAVEGSPQSKADIVTGYVARFSSAPDRVLVVGDQPSDFIAAEAAGTDFIAIVPDGRPADWAKPFPVVPDFAAFTLRVSADLT